MTKTYRVIIQVSEHINDRLVEESERLGIAKTAVVTFALQNYFLQKDAMQRVQDISVILDKLEKIESKLED